MCGTLRKFSVNMHHLVTIDSPGKRFVQVTMLPIILQDSDGEKSDDLVVDVSNEVSGAASHCK